MLSLIQLLDDEKCFKVVRELRWHDGVDCPHCHAPHVVKQGGDDTQRKFAALTGTVFAGHHHPLRQWVAFLVRAAPMTTLDRCLYLMELNLSNRQIAHELGLNEDDAHDMTRSLRHPLRYGRDRRGVSGGRAQGSE
jgi:transposase-like protein